MITLTKAGIKTTDTLAIGRASDTAVYLSASTNNIVLGDNHVPIDTSNAQFTISDNIINCKGSNAVVIPPYCFTKNTKIVLGNFTIVNSNTSAGSVQFDINNKTATNTNCVFTQHLPQYYDALAKLIGTINCEISTSICLSNVAYNGNVGIAESNAFKNNGTFSGVSYNLSNRAPSIAHKNVKVGENHFSSTTGSVSYSNGTLSFVNYNTSQKYVYYTVYVTVL